MLNSALTEYTHYTVVFHTAASIVKIMNLKWDW